MTVEEFLAEVRRLEEAGDAIGLHRFGKEHLNEMSPRLTSEQYEGLAGGTFEWAAMSAAMADEEAAATG